MTQRKKQPFYKKVLTALLFGVLLVGGIGGYYAFKVLFQSNVSLGEKKSKIIYIPTGSSFEDVVKVLGEEELLKDRSTFEFLAHKKGYVNAVNPGKFRVLAKMNNNELVNILLHDIQEPIEIHFRGLRSRKDLIARVASRIEATSDELHAVLYDEELLAKRGFVNDNVMALLIHFPNAYSFKWNTSAEQFMDSVATRYKKFWTAPRKKQATALGLSQSEVTTLASIVQGEQCCVDEEKKTIAGLYLNRLKKGMALQSDPTVIYAIGDFTINRVSRAQTKVKSPYNTYYTKGLPPGPIAFAKTSSIDAVLNAEENNYIYMCAKEDFSGLHNFTKSYVQHKKNARLYQKELDKRGIH